MKKILSAVISAAAALSLSVSAFAAESGISVKNNIASSKPVSYTYDPQEAGEVSKSIKALMTELDKLSGKNSVVQTLTVTSESEEGTGVNLKLRISIPPKTSASAGPVKTPSPDDYKALDYYNVKVTTSDGEVVYDYENPPETYAFDGMTYKDIPIGTMNTEKTSESKIYNVTLTVNKDLNKQAIATSAKKLEWSIVSNTFEAKEETPAPVTIPPTALPEAEVTVTATPEAAVTAPTATPNFKTDKNGVAKLSKGEYLTGTDVEAGRYTMTGTGKVHVYTPEGVLKTTIALKAKDDTSTNGVSEYVINLEDGERVNVEDSIELAPFTAPTATPRATSVPSGSSSSSAKATTAPASSKNNPKTGDSAPLLTVSAVGILSLAGFVLLFILKRKEN